MTNPTDPIIIMIDDEDEDVLIDNSESKTDYVWPLAILIVIGFILYGLYTVNPQFFEPIFTLLLKFKTGG